MFKSKTFDIMIQNDLINIKKFMQSENIALN